MSLCEIRRIPSGDCERAPLLQPVLTDNEKKKTFDYYGNIEATREKCNSG
jgi:hypothetical protein